jgi:hypothetical protein
MEMNTLRHVWRVEQIQAIVVQVILDGEPAVGHEVEQSTPGWLKSKDVPPKVAGSSQVPASDEYTQAEVTHRDGVSPKDT